jgi:hypothetical protein
VLRDDGSKELVDPFPPAAADAAAAREDRVVRVMLALMSLLGGPLVSCGLFSILGQEGVSLSTAFLVAPLFLFGPPLLGILGCVAALNEGKARRKVVLVGAALIVLVIVPLSFVFILAGAMAGPH